MKSHSVKIKEISDVTHDVLRITTQKPEYYLFKPGQATNISINKEGWEKKKRPFTFTSLPEDEDLEFTIKVYQTHKGVTNEISKLTAGDELILHDVYGSINYSGEGIFIAGGSGITPFISILRMLQKEGKVNNNSLIFANKTKDDIIYYEELKEMLGNNFINILSDEDLEEFESGFVTKEIIEKQISSKNIYIYVCGPPPMMKSVLSDLKEIGIPKDKIIKEEF